MKKSEDLGTTLRRIIDELAKNKVVMKKVNKKIARLNKGMRMLRQHLKNHSHKAMEPVDSAVIHLAAPTHGKKLRRYNALLLRIQTGWEKKLEKDKKERARARKDAVRIIRHGKKTLTAEEKETIS